MALKAPRKLNREELKAYAGELLAAKAQSRAEVRTKLRRKAADPGDVEEVMSSLEEYGAVDDAKFAGHFADARAVAGRYGKRRVLADLLAKRVAPETAREAVEGAFAGIDEGEAVGRWLEQKYRRQNLAELLQSDSKFASVYRRLRTAGFGHAASLRGLKAAASRVVEMDEPQE
jgi:SOS response regulatory protein OraA/RecX